MASAGRAGSPFEAPPLQPRPPRRRTSGAGLDDDAPRKFLGPSLDAGGTSSSGGGAPPPPRLGDPLSLAEAEQLMACIGPKQLPESWKQGFFFAGYQKYGLQQVEGGCCGVIAVIQAYLLKSLIQKGVNPASVLEVDVTARNEALVDALAEVIFTNAGDGKQAVILTPSSAAVPLLNASQLLCLRPATFSSYEQLRYYLMQRPYRDLFLTPTGFGVPLLLYSLVWTRTVQGIMERDADDPKTVAMIGAHGYCTQELVNLMVFGRAYSNVFDGTKRLGSSADGWCVLQGVPKRPSVGFLSLFEAFKCIEVGSRYKGPVAPVWIVCAESHYTTLFAVESSVDAKDSERAVDLYYFNSLASCQVHARNWRSRSEKWVGVASGTAVGTAVAVAVACILIS